MIMYVCYFGTSVYIIYYVAGADFLGGCRGVRTPQNFLAPPPEKFEKAEDEQSPSDLQIVGEVLTSF
jgi:hypothetical protein